MHLHEFWKGKILHLIYDFFSYADENAPCVGLCYHNKLKCFNDENCEDFDKGWPHNYKEFGPPCVGICYLLRELNMPNPGYQFQHTGVK